VHLEKQPLGHGLCCRKRSRPSGRETRCLHESEIDAQAHVAPTGERGDDSRDHDQQSRLRETAQKAGGSGEIPGGDQEGHRVHREDPRGAGPQAVLRNQVCSRYRRLLHVVAGLHAQIVISVQRLVPGDSRGRTRWSGRGMSCPGRSPEPVEEIANAKRGLNCEAPFFMNIPQNTPSCGRG